MQSTATSPNEYLQNLSDERRPIITAMREAILKNLPKGFEEQMNYGMLGYVVPHSVYPSGYHCDPKLPLPFISLASQKNHFALYHMGLYDGELLTWFREEWPNHSKKKLDMGKCCIRFKKPEDVPMELIGQLVSKVTPQQWIEYYDQNVKRAK
ncbi:MAG: DUF1801 domain-containing protein [Saprospiraceae bacterium]|nr:DUF1801 domain-containing protein [Saprospiraceae bacterium]MCF8248280.1 DUF1801 domain-containing protein [Saprospiraceae bacterium]MCF8279966.1 DUF1801 domain-containing protein [Bacteroidales bacterium]MCF8309808.1 DUF1801 domain-containing protein [Saprospiraceae bacterium]MCF8438861.1 DUF1801 domain-containing protein [Saprospiraceae bacterium]